MQTARILILSTKLLMASALQPIGPPDRGNSSHLRKVLDKDLEVAVTSRSVFQRRTLHFIYENSGNGKHGGWIVVPESERPNDIDTVVAITVMNPSKLAESRVVDD